MKTTTVPETKTAAGVRTASVLADAAVWPSAFQAALQEEGFTVFTSRELHELFDRSHDGAPDLLILAKRDARFAVRACHAVRGLKDVPTIVVIPSESDFGPVMDAGADDAITASSDGAVFAARVRALLRRAQRWQTGQNDGGITVRDLTIDLDKCEVALRGRPVPLTPTELRLLAVLAEKGGKGLDARTLLSSAHEHAYNDRPARNPGK